MKRYNSSMARNRYVLFAILLSVCATLVAKEKKPPPPACSLSFVILRDESGKPVRNAAVVMHPVENNGKQEKGGLELKTDSNGEASYDGVPYGKLRVQVLAPGFQTFGEDYDISQPELAVTVRLKRPSGQYSIYEDHPQAKTGDTSKPPQ